MPFPLSPEEVERIRAIEIAKGNFPDVMETEEAALFTRRCVSELLKSNAPRTREKKNGKVKGRKIVWLKSQLLAWMKNDSTYDAEKPLKRAS